MKRPPSPITIPTMNSTGDTESQDGRDPKRRRSAPLPLDVSVAMAMKPEKNINVIDDGDVLLVVNKIQGEEKPTGLLCSSGALSVASSVFKDALAAPVVPPAPAPATDSSATSTTSATQRTGKLVVLPEDDGDALILILYILHFRNQALPAYIPPDTLIRVGVLATKYRCAHAVSRATTQWFDRIYTGMSSQGSLIEILKMIQAAFILDEAMYFARFTGRYVRAMPPKSAKSEPATNEYLSEGVKRIKSALATRQADIFNSLRLDIDLLIEPCSLALSKEAHHFIDWPPDVEPETSPSDDTPKVVCAVDSQGAPLYLGAMRDAGLWPVSVWGSSTADNLIEAVAKFREPEYDDCDKCEFCIPLVEEFERKLILVKKMHSERLWGLCLDCFTAGGVNAGECRFAHVKSAAAKTQT